MLFRLAKRSSVQRIVNLSSNCSSSRIASQRHFCCVFTFKQQRCNNILESVTEKYQYPNHPPTTSSILRAFSTEHNDNQPEANPGIVKRFKQMFKDYWYVLLPVHVATSAVWLGGFYVALKSGVDIVGLLERLGTSERILDYLRHSEAGYIALSYACYKIATPARYAVTVGGTTLGQVRLSEETVFVQFLLTAISKLKDTGYLKSTSEVASQLRESKNAIKETKEKFKEDLEKRKDRD